MKKVLLIVAVVLVLGLGALVFHATVNGYIADPAFEYSYQTASSNHRYVFVMLGPKPLFSTDNHWRDDRMALTGQLQAKYSVSGLYSNDGSTTPIWQMKQYSRAVFVPTDGIHLASPAQWPTTASDNALSFYENGKLIRSYRVRDLVDLPWFLPGGHGHFEWAKDINLDESNGRLIVNTSHFDHYVFDLATGSITSARRPGRLVFLLLLLGTLSLFLWRQKKRSA